MIQPHDVFSVFITITMLWLIYTVLIGTVRWFYAASKPGKNDHIQITE